MADPDTIWLGLEYFCREGDELWSMADGRLSNSPPTSSKDRSHRARDVLDGTVVRVPKAYPAYFGEYRQFDDVRAYLDDSAIYIPIGRNGMHRYNNQDHSMLAAKGAVRFDHQRRPRASPKSGTSTPTTTITRKTRSVALTHRHAQLTKIVTM